MNAHSDTMLVQIIDFEDQYAQDFARLNYKWLEEFFTVEPHDREMLDEPKSYIIDQGGHVFFAQLGDQIVGTVALIKEDHETYEVAKMAVSPEYQGHKIGKQLLDYVIAFGRKSGTTRLVLESNTKLPPALNLYIKTGFKVIPLNEGSPYARCNIRMELKL
ncbi:MAG: GNAT family N-acetyltransferase [Cyclobacteriaceae bacterium]